MVAKAVPPRAAKYSPTSVPRSFQRFRHSRALSREISMTENLSHAVTNGLLGRGRSLLGRRRRCPWHLESGILHRRVDLDFGETDLLAGTVPARGMLLDGKRKHHSIDLPVVGGIAFQFYVCALHRGLDQ